MVTVYGMSEKVGNVSFYDPQQESTFTKPYSEETGKLIDSEVRVLVAQAYERTKALLTEKKAEVEKIALALLDREVLHQQDVEDLIGKRPYGEKKIFADDEDESPAQSTTVDAPVAEEPINPEPIQEESNPA
jgi:cell division protease FtsH